VAPRIIWKEITTAFKGRMIGGSYAVEGGFVRVRLSPGEKVAAQLGGTEFCDTPAERHISGAQAPKFPNTYLTVEERRFVGSGGKAASSAIGGANGY